ncbi:MAG: phosphatase PAP2 family protein [Microbacterium sp.]
MLGVIVTVIAGFAITASGKGPTALDTAWHDLMLSWRTDPGIAVATWMQSAGGVGSMFIVGLVLAMGLFVMRRPWSALTITAAMILSEAATAAFKVLVARPRPSDSLSDTGLTSFPSGHTTLAATTMVVLALLIGRGFWVIATLWITMMAWSRTYLEAHWLTDVLAGALLGTSIALIVWWAVRVLQERRSRRLPLSVEEPGRK